MKWPLRKRVRLDKDEGAQDLQKAKRQLRQVQSRWPEVNRLVDKLGTMNEQNHFSQLITEAMQGGRE
jgi:hypothetical protein